MFLIRSRFRAIFNSKQSRMEQNQSIPFSPRIFGGFLSRNISDEISATKKQFCNSINHPFVGYYENLFKPSSPYYEQKGIGIVLEKEDFDCFFKPNRKLVIFGANLMKVKVPLPFSNKSPGDFGIKTKNSPCFRGKLEDQEGLMEMEMEMSEEYTCVMKHGPNPPKTIHIFYDTIVETNCLYDLHKDDAIANSLLMTDFLGFCYNCKVKLDNGKDIYMYRGEKGFCSSECRFREMVMEEEEHEKIFDYYY